MAIERLAVSNVSAYRSNPFKYEFAKRWNHYLLQNANLDIHKKSFGELMIEALAIFIRMVDEDVRSIEAAGGSVGSDTTEAKKPDQAEVPTGSSNQEDGT